MRVLFLCTGNYYRSRFAEEYFNALSRQKGLAHRAASRGLSRKFDTNINQGPISENARAFLSAMNILLPHKTRMPKKLTAAELPQFELIVCLDKDEHWPMVRKRPELKKRRIIYWKIKDLDKEPANEALPKCKKKVEELIHQIENRYFN